MAKKQTNLCVAADLTIAADVLNLAKQVGPYICCIKTHIDVIEDFHPNFVRRLQEIAEMYEFMLMEDRKFADIGKTVQMQYSKVVFNISSWVTLVTVHSIFRKGVLDAISKVDSDRRKGVFLLAEASASGTLIDEKYTGETLKIASEYDGLIVGVVCQSPLFRDKKKTSSINTGSSSG
ncbi:hypothetical protein HHI36_022024 [Cryptolaemus montrouzieri]|uniref:Orotidine 5'-phosphate decarboxylase n=1 Tax=Cryptolaemus montrouzieri TaxID=559131 RepID=A0ABD2MYY8_9CUCU